jgi:hypothetical protein
MSIREYLISNVEGLNEGNFNLVMEQVDADFSGAPKRVAESKVTTSEVSGIMDIIEANFSGVEFQNKDLSPLVKDLTARQIPSRLKKLVDAGKLQDLGGSPKKYKLT